MQHDIGVIYKYMNLERAISLFSDLEMRKTQISALNDIFENLKELKSSDPMERAVENINNNYGIAVTCYSETPHNLLMWAHYADSYKGVVVGFKTDDIFFNNLHRVRYREHFENGDSQYEDRILLKGNDWMYEKEWRQIWDTSKDWHEDGGAVTNNEDSGESNGPEEKDIYRIDIPKDIITHLYVGPRFEENSSGDENNREKLAEIISDKYPDLLRKRMQASNISYKLEVGDNW